MANANYAERKIDISILLIYLLLMAIGIGCIYANEQKENIQFLNELIARKSEFSKQFFWAIGCLLMGIFILLIDTKLFSNLSYPLYGLGILLCLITLFVGTEIRGSHSWLTLAGVKFQPSELTKLFTCLALSKFISSQGDGIVEWRTQALSAALVLIPAAITIAQNETGLALVYCSFFIAMYREGLPSFILIVGVCMGIMVVVSLVANTTTLLIAYTLIALCSIFIFQKHARNKTQFFYYTLVAWAWACTISIFILPFMLNHVFKPYQRDRLYSLIGKTQS